MITFNLKLKWFNQIVWCKKRVEYREAKPYWVTRLLNVVKNNEYDCCFRCGYTTQHFYGIITKIELVNGLDTDLHIDKPVFAIHFVTDDWTV